MAPQPKPPGTRARRNSDQASWRPVEGLDAKQLPACPLRKPMKAARDYWTDVLAELGGMYGEADLKPLARAALLHGKVMSDKHTASELAALLALEDRLGINPHSRRRLMWELRKAGVDGDPEQAAPRTDRQRRRRAGGKDVRLALVQ